MFNLVCVHLYVKDFIQSTILLKLKGPFLSETVFTYYSSSSLQTFSVLIVVHIQYYTRVSLIITFCILLFTICSDALSKHKPQIIVTENFQIAFQSIIFKNISNNFLLQVRPVYSKRQPQCIVHNSIKSFSENIKRLSMLCS